MSLVANPGWRPRCRPRRGHGHTAPMNEEMKIAAGDEAPDFELPDQDGNPVRLSSFAGRPIVLYFYPKAGTRGSIRNNGRHDLTPARHRHRPRQPTQGPQWRIVPVA